MKKLLLISICLLMINSFEYKILKVISNEPQVLEIPITYKSDEIYDLINHSLEKTTDLLSFNLKSKNNYDVSKIYGSGEAHCVGYVVLFNSILDKTFKENNIKNYEIKHARAEILIYSFNPHDMFSDPAFKNHDISIVIDGDGNEYYVDPSLSEVFGKIVIKQ